MKRIARTNANEVQTVKKPVQRKFVAIGFIAAVWAALLFVIVRNFAQISTESVLKLIGISIFLIVGLTLLNAWLRDKAEVGGYVRLSLELLVALMAGGVSVWLFN